MRIATTKAEVKAAVASWRAAGQTVGLVPTMGYLHEGHESLIDAARNACDRVVVSVFVNPIQFGPNEDFDSYPRDLEHDADICEEHGADLVFHPTEDEMYPAGFATRVAVDALAQTLCGAARPNHFQGVCTVVCKLMNIVRPDKAFFGQKDAQQLAIVKRMVRDLDMDVNVVGCPIVREADGLAKSSRNTYLSVSERLAAPVLSRAIFAGRKAVENGLRDTAELKRLMRDILESEPLARVDYLEVVDGLTMQPVTAIGDEALVAMAVFIGGTRLIDNFIFEENQG